ncbi:MAG: hypothetical protein O8C67_06085 [Candidatus Methanoperedens sp.]|nr:hypothetical protein [Candidatus Methanoperedens sp.]
MSAGNFNFEIEQGVTFSKTFTWKDSGGNAITIAGYTIRMMARNDYGDTLPVISLSTVTPTPGGIAIVGDGSAGQFTITISATVTAGYNFSTLKYDLEAISGAGVVTRLLEGEITLSKEVTK